MALTDSIVSELCVCLVNEEGAFIYLSGTKLEVDNEFIRDFLESDARS